MPRRRPEEELQIQVVKWIRSTLPHLLVVHVPNGGKRSVAEAARFKRAGVVAGMPDLQVYGYGGLMIHIELKAPKNGQLSDAQKQMHDLLREKGQRVEICRSINDVADALRDAGLVNPVTNRTAPPQAPANSNRSKVEESATAKPRVQERISAAEYRRMFKLDR